MVSHCLLGAEWACWRTVPSAAAIAAHHFWWAPSFIVSGWRGASATHSGIALFVFWGEQGVCGPDTGQDWAGAVSATWSRWCLGLQPLGTCSVCGIADTWHAHSAQPHSIQGAARLLQARLRLGAGTLLQQLHATAYVVRWPTCIQCGTHLFC